MGLIRLIFWICFAVVLSYLMTDIKVADKNIKQHIDAVLFDDPNASLNEKFVSLKNRITGKEEKPALKKPPEETPAKTIEVPKADAITKEDRNKLENIIEKAN